MSALTDPFNDDTKVRERGVSWDANACDISPTDKLELQFREEDPLASILQPILNEEPPRSILTSPARNPLNRVEEKLDMATIVNPIESEAETTIMNALEARERKLRRLTAATIMPHLSEEAISNVQEYDVQHERRAAEYLPSPIRSTGSSSRKKRRNNLAAGKQTIVASADQDVSPRHRRPSTPEKDDDDTMEQTLYNLAAMMRDIHSSAIEPFDESLSRRVLPSDDIGHPVAEHPVEHPKTRFDALVNDAALLFRGQTRIATVPAKTSSVLSDPKKNDDAAPGTNTDEHDDAEVGLVRDSGLPASSGKETCFPSMCRCCFLKSAKDDWETFEQFLKGRKQTLFSYAKLALCYLIIPSTTVAAILYYGASNPSLPFGFDVSSQRYPSVSWFIIFIGVRQVITLCLAKMTEIFLIDFLALKTHYVIRLFGKFWSLTIVQSKGWPSLLFFWAFYDLCMLTGSGSFANHWLYYQNAIELFNAENFSGDVTSNIWNFRIVIAALMLGIVAALKRILTGLCLGGRQYCKYSHSQNVHFTAPLLTVKTPCQLRTVRSWRFSFVR